MREEVRMTQTLAGRGSRAGECRWPPAAGKSKELGLSGCHQKKHGPANTWISAQRDLLWISDLQNLSKTNVYCFEPLAL